MSAIVGRVIDEKTAQGAAYASVAIYRDADELLCTRANAEGRFSIPTTGLPKRPKLEIRATAVDYRSLSKEARDTEAAGALRLPDSVRRDKQCGTVEQLSSRPIELVVAGYHADHRWSGPAFLVALVIALGITISGYIYLHARCPNPGVPYDDALSAIVDSVYQENWRQIGDPNREQHDRVCRGQLSFLQFFLSVVRADRVVDPATVPQPAAQDAGDAGVEMAVSDVAVESDVESVLDVAVASADVANAVAEDITGEVAPGSEDGSVTDNAVELNAEPDAEATTSDESEAEPDQTAQRAAQTATAAATNDTADLKAILTQVTELFDEALAQNGGMPPAQVDVARTLFKRAATLVENKEHGRADAVLATLRTQLRHPPSYFWELQQWRLAETFLWALIATLIRLILNTGRYIWTRRFIMPAIGSHVTLICAVPILAVLISFVSSMLSVKVDIGGTAALDLSDVRTSILIAAFIGFAPWKAWEFLAAIGDRFFVWLTGLVAPKESSDDAPMERTSVSRYTYLRPRPRPPANDVAPGDGIGAASVDPTAASSAVPTDTVGALPSAGEGDAATTTRTPPAAAAPAQGQSNDE